jgi:lipoprotein-anchoring transpeptidase ErfK/SrfK
VRVSVVSVALVLVSLAACGGEQARPRAQATTHVTTTEAAPPAGACKAGAFRHLGTRRLAYVAIVRHRAGVAGRPGGRPFARFGRQNINGVPNVFSIRGARLDRNCKPRSYLVQVARRPNGVTGWVAARQVAVAKVKTRIVVDLSDRRVTLYRDGRRVLSATAAIGSSATPTPTGRFYVNQRLIPTDKSGPFGPGAVGISAFSEVLTGWAQGGPIAIHGTNAPWSIGQAVSNGCIRLPNATLRRFFAQALNGTPVLIRS